MREITLSEATLDYGHITFSKKGDSDFFPKDCFGDHGLNGSKGDSVVFKCLVSDVDAFIRRAERGLPTEAEWEIESDVRVMHGDRLSPRRSFQRYLRQVGARTGDTLLVTRTQEREYRVEHVRRYAKGEGVTQDAGEAVKWYRLAAEQGHTSAQYYLGICYDFGRGVTQDKEEAVKWYRLAADQGHADAQFNLGLCYFKGEGVTQDAGEAEKLYRLLARAQNYFKGEGVTQDAGEAEKLYRLLARAQNSLGVR